LAGRERGRPRTLLALEVIQAVRHPANLSAALLLAGLAGVLVASTRARSALLWPQGAVLVLAMISIVPIGSYGATWRAHWLYRCGSTRPTVWIGPKWTAMGAICAVLLASLTAIFLLTPGWAVGVAVAVLPHLVTGFVAAMVVGLVLPVSEEQPLSSVASVVLAAGLAAGLSYLVDRVSDSYAGAAAVAAVVTVGGVAAYVRLVSWRESDLVHQ
jgi:hypothetical protein